MAELASHGIHLHFYGEITHGQWLQWIEKTQAMAPGYLHLHPNVDQSRWTEEFSQYDAGWLHLFDSRNEGEIRKANWDDLNYPARLSTLGGSRSAHAAESKRRRARCNPNADKATWHPEYSLKRWMSLQPSYETASS